VGNQYISPKLTLTNAPEEALVVFGKRKAKRSRDMIIKLSKGLVKPEVVVK
jgi:hypothetical protein